MNKKVNWGIIGLGKIAHKFANDLLLIEDAELHAVASRNINKAKDFGQKYSVREYYGSYSELAQDPKIDIVYIATPHVFHFEYSKLCLENGKSVLCEKPLGMNEKEVKALIELAGSKNLFLMEGLWTRFIPAFEKVLSLLNQNVIGELHSVKADFGFMAAKDLKGRLYNKDLGGGSLLDIGIYPVYLALMTLGIPKGIKSHSTMTPEGIDSACEMLFDYENNVKANLESTFEANTPTEAYIYGTKGHIKLHYRFHHTENISLVLNDAPEQRFEIKYRGEGYFHEILEVNLCLKQKKLESSKHPLKRSLQLIKILDRVRHQIGLKYKSDL